jgi:hypothetical protein
VAAVAVTADNNRVNAADSTTNWANDGGGGGIANEPDVTYQNNIAQSRKIGTARIGRAYDPAAGAVDMTVADRRHWLMKITATNPSALITRASPALGIKIGSSSADYYEVYVAGNDNYPPRGGWLLIPVSPNVSGYRDATTGSPTLTAVDYWSVLGDFSATAKAENVAIDAIDIGAGLHLVGGDGASTDGVFQDFVDFDEGTVAGRYGYVFTEGSLILVNGRLAIGRNTSDTAVATVFQDTGKVVTWKNGYAETGFHRLLVDLGSATTDVDLTSCTLISEGEKNNTLGLGYTTTEDTRTIFEVIGTSGAFNLTSCNVQNFQDVILTSVCVIDGCDIETESLTQSSAEIKNSKIRTTSVTSVAALQDPIFGLSDLHDTEFIQAGAGHAVELSSIGATVTLTNMSWTGYGADASDAAAIDVTAASGTTTINWSGGTEPTYKTAGATVVRVNSVAVKVTTKDAADSSIIAGARVLLLAATGGALPFEDTVTITRSGTTASVSHTAHGMSNGAKVRIEGADQEEYNGIQTISNVSANAYDYTVSGAPDTPATGTIKATAVVLDGTTNGSGIIEDTGFNFGTDQPVAGVARKGTASPFYKASPISGTITSSGADLTAFMVSDE